MVRRDPPAPDAPGRDTAPTAGAPQRGVPPGADGTGAAPGARVPVPDLDRRAHLVAPGLIGCELWVDGVGVRIVEVEAYEGPDDPASHAWRGQTARNAAMFGPSGHLYVYQMHGHFCCNVVCGPPGTAHGVLIRAGEVIEGLDAARERRVGVRDAQLARGPGNLTRTLGITRADNATPLLTGGRVRLLPGERTAAVAAGPRVNVSRAHDRPWRFVDPASAAVSAFKWHPATRTPKADPATA